VAEEVADIRVIIRELLADVRATIKTVRKLMKSEDQDVQVFAIDVFTKLAEMEMTLLDALGGEKQTEERNPLARRLRLDR